MTTMGSFMRYSKSPWFDTIARFTKRGFFTTLYPGCHYVGVFLSTTSSDWRASAGRLLCGQIRRLLLAICLLVLAALAAPSAKANDGIEFSDAALQLTEEGYVLSSNFAVDLTHPLEDALMRGIPLYFKLQLEVSRPRWYWFDDVAITQFGSEIAEFTVDTGHDDGLAIANEVAGRGRRSRGRLFGVAAPLDRYREFAHAGILSWEGKTTARGRSWGRSGGRYWVRTSDPSRVKRVL